MWESVIYDQHERKLQMLKEKCCGCHWRRRVRNKYFLTEQMYFTDLERIMGLVEAHSIVEKWINSYDLEALVIQIFYFWSNLTDTSNFEVSRGSTGLTI